MRSGRVDPRFGKVSGSPKMPNRQYLLSPPQSEVNSRQRYLTDQCDSSRPIEEARGVKTNGRARFDERNGFGNHFMPQLVSISNGMLHGVRATGVSWEQGPAVAA